MIFPPKSAAPVRCQVQIRPGTRFDVSLLSLKEFPVSNVLYNPLYWDKKIKIAILALATFAALC